MNSLVQFDHRHILNQIPRPLIGTCQWIAQDPEFQRWQRSSSNSLEPSTCRVLSIFGSPGVGKTVMSRYVLTYLLQKQKHLVEEPPIIVFFFCDDKDPTRRDSMSLLRSLLSQILNYDKQLLRYISEDVMDALLQQPRDNYNVSDEIQDPWTALSSIVQRTRTRKFWFVIDAMDELDTASRKAVYRQLARVLDLDVIGRLKVLLTDRQGARYHFPGQAVLELGASASDSQNDVRTYVRQSISELSEDVPIEPKIKSAIEDEIAMMANGTFLHASLALANFTKGVTVWTPHIIRDRLSDLQKLPASLEAYYAGLLRHIPADFQRKARRAFTWVLGSITRRPLTLQELHYAVSINNDQVRISKLAVPQAILWTTSCKTERTYHTLYIPGMLSQSDLRPDLNTLT